MTVEQGKQDGAHKERPVYGKSSFRSILFKLLTAENPREALNEKEFARLERFVQTGHISLRGGVVRLSDEAARYLLLRNHKPDAQRRGRKPKQRLTKEQLWAKLTE